MDDKTETTSVIWALFQGWKGSSLYKKPIVSSIESPAMQSHRKVVHEFRIKKKKIPILHPVT